VEDEHLAGDGVFEPVARADHRVSSR
jgi:hypothetical protein